MSVSWLGVVLQVVGIEISFLVFGFLDVKARRLFVNELYGLLIMVYCNVVCRTSRSRSECESR